MSSLANRSGSLPPKRDRVFGISFGVALILMAASSANAAAPVNKVEHHPNDAWYYYQEWSTKKTKQWDVAPAPAGGMHNFVAKLHYPEDLRRRRVGGAMRVYISLDNTGQGLEVKMDAVNPQLDRIVIDAVRKTKWTPAGKNKTAIPAKF